MLFACATVDAGPTEVTPREAPRAVLAVRLSDPPGSSSDDPDEAVAPQSQATLLLVHDSGQREEHDLGRLSGACVPRVPQDDELLRVVCWWAGEESTMSVRRSSTSVVVTVRDSTRQTEPITRARVPLADDVELDPVTP